MPREPYHTVWAVFVFGWLNIYLLRMALAPILPPLMGEFGLTFTEAGLLATAYFYAYAAMQVPAGLLGEVFGRKRVLVAGTLTWAVASLLTGLTTSFAQIFAARFVAGLGMGSYFGNDRPLIAAATPREKMGVGQAVSFTGGGLGLFLGLVLAGLVAEAWGWRAAFVLLSLPSFLAAASVWRFIREPASAGRLAWRWHPYRALLRSADLWRLYLAQATNIYAMSLVGTWAPAMFQEVGVTGLGASSLYASLLGLAALPGLLLFGWASDRAAGRGLGRKGVMALSYAGVAAAFLGLGIAIGLRAPAAALAAGIFLAGIFLWGCYGPAYAVLGDLAPPEVLGTAFGLCNTVAFLGALAAPMATGWIRDLTGSFAGGCYAAAGLALVGTLLALSIPPAFRLAPEGARAGGP